jgi:hypothetical protein
MPSPAASTQTATASGTGTLTALNATTRKVTLDHGPIPAIKWPAMKMATQLGLWSFAMAIAHGAGLMLIPIYLGLCRAADLDKGHEAAGALINANLGMAVLVSVVHSVPMMTAGGFSAWLVYRYLGLKFVSRSWFNLDATWAVSLILVGVLSLAIIIANEH